MRHWHNFRQPSAGPTYSRILSDGALAKFGESIGWEMFGACCQCRASLAVMNKGD